MTIETIVRALQDFFHQYTLLAVIIVLALLICLFRNPKEFFKFTAVIAVLGVAFYFLLLFGGTLSTGTDQKNRAVHKSRNALDDAPPE